MDFEKLRGEAIRFVVTVIAAGSLGGYFAYQKALTAPVPAQYVVVDLAEFSRTLQREIDPSKPSGQIALRELGTSLKGSFKELTEAGVVVLDASMVLAAPAAAYVDPAELVMKLSKGEANAAQKPTR